VTKILSDKNYFDENFVQENLHLQAVLLEKGDKICQGDEHFGRHCFVR